MILTIFGAGASYGSFECKEGRCPPLGNKVFDDLVQLGGAFSRLPPELHPIFREIGFEAGMALVADSNASINPLQRELASFLVNFHITSNNTYYRLFREIRSIASDLAVATLNYDMLIEQALIYNGIKYDYNASPGLVPLLKVHGSCNFLPEIPPMASSVVMHDVGEFYRGFRTRIGENTEEILGWLKSPQNEHVSPVMAMYNREKRVVVNSDLINKIQENFHARVAEAAHIFIVGVAYVPHDEHIWGALAKTRAQVHVYDPYPAAIVEWANSAGRGDISIHEVGFAQGLSDLIGSIKTACASR